MIDKTVEIKAFLKKHYSPGDLGNSKKELLLNSDEVLCLLFQVFPNGCIDDYDLFDILKSLNYEPQKKNSTKFIWCLIEN